MTDNITPQAPETKASMTADEIVSRLGRLEACCILKVPGNITAQDKQTLTAAVQAVGLLEEIKVELRGDCVACKSRDVQGTQEPCASCTNKYNLWEFRWPLGEEADHGTH